eukprot:scaffold3205_cov688-Prasinococcus_capsulatus_cf.AAC.6
MALPFDARAAHSDRECHQARDAAEPRADLPPRGGTQCQMRGSCHRRPKWAMRGPTLARVSLDAVMPVCSAGGRMAAPRNALSRSGDRSSPQFASCSPTPARYSPPGRYACHAADTLLRLLSEREPARAHLDATDASPLRRDRYSFPILGQRLV